MKLSEAIVHRLLALMQEKQFSQYDFYTKGGIPKSTVSQILNGSRGERIAVTTLYEMTAVMKVTLAEFFLPTQSSTRSPIKNCHFNVRNPPKRSCTDFVWGICST